MSLWGRFMCWKGWHEEGHSLHPPRKENIVAVKDEVTGQTVNYTMFATYSWCKREGCDWKKTGLGRGTIT